MGESTGPCLSEGLPAALRRIERIVGPGKTHQVVLVIAVALLDELRESGRYDAPTFFGPVTETELAFVSLTEEFPYLLRDLEAELETLPLLKRIVNPLSPK